MDERERERERERETQIREGEGDRVATLPLSTTFTPQHLTI